MLAGNLPGIVASFTRALAVRPAGVSATATATALFAVEGDPAAPALGPAAGDLEAAWAEQRAAVAWTAEGARAAAAPAPAVVADAAAAAGAAAEAVAEAEAVAAAEALRPQLHRYSRMLLLTLALEVDRLEQLIRRHHPEYHYIDLEVL